MFVLGRSDLLHNGQELQIHRDIQLKQVPDPENGIFLFQNLNKLC